MQIRRLFLLVGHSIHQPLSTQKHFSGNAKPSSPLNRSANPLGALVQGECEMGIILWLVVGGIIGWLASMVMRTDAQQGILLNIVVGIVGAFIGGLIFSGGSINDGLTLYSFLVSLVGAIVLLAIVNLVRRGSVR
jgi:uncharacterized membrane protein YeaQ/YmgE (transglycosylase-associated protein family)